ncbi:hypothetical protein H257_09481 [Aphanomyces astaci]|uniref:DDE Tnp4 domain-containing protein n=1 Tax=Aphanomyces astaci TaxID=112090 RepID=W4G9T9_APHAT|nr:hypothetical protein H257_09481 [Aphanomyces astaci]ETV76462.1 hypothetical protein H257_09481 [Aphanomyces astaci]|eukprot:XP_009834007.1 hypothetical protein H257_09481 [Aphanomyces astaci]
MAGMIVCDDQRRITYLDFGWTGCANDKRVWNNCNLAMNSTKYFNPNEYLMSDSGYTNQQHIMAAYTRTRSSGLTEQHMLFNKLVAKCRYVNEHCIGLLKGRFQSLRCMRLFGFQVNFTLAQQKMPNIIFPTELQFRRAARQHLPGQISLNFSLGLNYKPLHQALADAETSLATGFSLQLP